MTTDKKIVMLKPEEIKISDNGLRLSYDQVDLRLLAESIIANGICEPLNVKREENGEYTLISGERRLKAAMLAELRRVPCIIHKTDELSEFLMSLNGNIQTKPLHFIELGLAIEKLVNCYGLSISEIAVRLALDRNEVSNKLRILKLDSEMLRKIYSSNLSEAHIMPLLKLSPEMRMGVLEYIISKELTVSEAKAYVEETLNPSFKKSQKKPLRKYALADQRLFGNSLNKLCETMGKGGMNVHLSKNENDLFFEYRIRIRKEISELKGEQLKIC